MTVFGILVTQWPLRQTWVKQFSHKPQEKNINNPWQGNDLHLPYSMPMASISFYGFGEFNFARIHRFARHFPHILQTYNHYTGIQRIYLSKAHKEGPKG